jgi:Fe-S-cluster-containing hydrogenase component 2
MPTTKSKYKYINCKAEDICSYTKTGEFNTYRSRIRTVRAEEVLITAVACRTCQDAPCVIACPRKALSQDPESGVIRVDANQCDGCAWCIEACDFGALSINPSVKLAEICDQCEDQEDGPQCVKWCPKNALELTSADQRAQSARHKLAKEEVLGAKKK